MTTVTMIFEMTRALGEIARRNFTLARPDDAVFDAIQRIYRRSAVMALLVNGRRGAPRPENVLGVITKEHVADSVASSVNVHYGIRRRGAV